jgi:hypothetical protein
MSVALHFFLLVAHPKLRSFVLLCDWSILLLKSNPPLAHNTEFVYSQSALQQTLVQKVVSLVEKTLCYGF